MTKEEIGNLVAALPQGLDSDDFIYRLVNWAVDIEREACAKVCEEYQWADRAAEAIRARGDVHTSDISQERVDETAKREHEWVGLDDDIPGLGLVTEEFYNGMLCAEDILRKRNT